MTTILTQHQATAVSAAIKALAAIGALPNRIALEDGLVRLRVNSDGRITVKRIDAAGRLLAQRRYDNLARFVEKHQGDMSSFAALMDTGDKYDCIRCWRESGRLFRPVMFTCSICHNKRCPKASDHRLECVGSNEPGQKGSVYE